MLLQRNRVEFVYMPEKNKNKTATEERLVVRESLKMTRCYRNDSITIQHAITYVPCIGQSSYEQFYVFNFSPKNTTSYESINQNPKQTLC